MGEELRMRWYDVRRTLARRWKRFSRRVYEWIWPSSHSDIPPADPRKGDYDQGYWT